jgi:hypothetical protein
MKKILFIFILLLFSSVASATTTIEIQPSTLSVDPNDTFTITFYVIPGETIDTVATDLITWNPSILECIKIERGNLFETPTIWIKGTIQEGKITNLCWASNVNTISPGIFVNITFKAKSSGITTIIINPEKYGVALEGTPLDRIILNDCEITVTGQTQPPDNPPSNPPEEPETPDEPTTNETNETQPQQNNTNQTQNETTYSPPPENPPEEPNNPKNPETIEENTNTHFFALLSLWIIVALIFILFLYQRHEKIKEEDEINIFKEKEDEQITEDKDNLQKNN